MFHLKIPRFCDKIVGVVNRIIRPLSLIVLVIHAALSAGSCDLFNASLEDYLKKELADLMPGTEPDTNPSPTPSTPTDPGTDPGTGTGPGPGPGTESWVYLAVASGDDANSGLSSGEAVRSFGKALEIWKDTEGTAGARILLTESIATSQGYSDPATLTATGLVDFSTTLVIPPGITAITLTGSGNGKTIDNGGTPGRPVIYLNTPGITVTLQSLTLTRGRGNPGGGVYIGAGAGLIIEDRVIIEGNQTNIQGGGVYVNGVGATFTMKGGEIRGNEAVSATEGKGGGVCVDSNGTFVMEGGTIKNNTSGNDGGGLYVHGPNSKASILNGIIGGSSLADGNKAKYGAGVYVGADGELTLGRDNKADPYPYIQYNKSSGASPSTGGGVVINKINGSAAKAIFHHGTVTNNDGASLGGGILIVNGTLDMQGGTVTGNTAAAGPGITLESGGTLLMSKRARAMDPNNPVYFSVSGKRITLGTFTGDFSAGIANIKLPSSGYAAGDQVLGGILLNQFDKFEILPPASFDIDMYGKLQ
jgi:hypothetical protein